MRWRKGKRVHGEAAGPGDGGAASFAGGAQPSELPGPVVALLGAVQAMDPKPPVTLAMIGDFAGFGGISRDDTNKELVFMQWPCTVRTCSYHARRRCLQLSLCASDFVESACLGFWLTRWFSRCPDRVVVGRELRRLVVAPFLHQDELELYHNMQVLPDLLS